MQVIFNKGFDVSSILKKQHSSFLGSSFLAGLLFLTFSLNAYSDDLFIPLIDKADRARVEFNELYKYFLEQDPEVFKDSSEKLSENFKLKPNITGRILENGPVLLNLIEWLDKNKKNDVAGLLLLRKLNRFLYLEFRHFVGHLNVNKKYEGRLVGLLHNFYKFKVPAKSGSAEEKLKYEFPFQATISKSMLFILIVNASSLNYDEKVENVAYFLDKIRRELLEIKSRYSDDCNIRTADVSDFVELLQTYAAKEPILGPNYLKRILIISMVIGVIALVVWLVWTKVMPNWDQILDYSSNRGHEMYVRLIDPIADIFADKLGEKFRQKAHVIVAETLNTFYDAGVEIGFRQVVRNKVPVPEGMPDVAAPAQVNELRQEAGHVEDPAAAAEIAVARDDVGSEKISWGQWLFGR